MERNFGLFLDTPHDYINCNWSDLNKEQEADRKISVRREILDMLLSSIFAKQL